jgi:hypothetical protein
MAVSVIQTSFRYTAASTSNIVLSGWGFQPKAIIVHWNGVDSATDAVGSDSIACGWGFAIGSGTSNQRCASYVSTDGGTSSAGSTWHQDAVIAIADNTATLDGYINVSSFDSGGVTFAVPDAISFGFTCMVIGIGGDDITNVYVGSDTTNTATGNKSNTAVGFQPDIMFFTACHDGNNAYAGGGGSNSEAGVSFGAAMSSTAQYCVSVAQDDNSTTMDTGAYITDNEFLSSQSVSTPATIVDRKKMVTMDTNGFTWNQLELPQTASCYFHFLAIKGGSWAVGDFLTQTDTSTTVTESGLSFTPKLVIAASANRAKSTTDTGTTNASMSFGAATSTSQRMAMAIWDQNGTADAETATAVEYDEIYANIDSSDAIQGLLDITDMSSGQLQFINDDADPSQCFVWYATLGDSAAAATTVSLLMLLGAG